MIGYLHGTALAHDLVTTSCGVGYLVYTTKALTEGEKVDLFITEVIREDVHDLYGFDNRNEQDLFGILKKITGVGPRTALSVLSHLGMNRTVTALVENQPKTLAEVPGIGIKKAQTIITAATLPEHLADLAVDETEHGPNDRKRDIVDALASIGYNASKVETLLESMDMNKDENDIMAELMGALNGENHG